MGENNDDFSLFFPPFPKSPYSEFLGAAFIFLESSILFPPILLTKPIKTLTIKLTGSDQL